MRKNKGFIIAIIILSIALIASGIYIMYEKEFFLSKKEETAEETLNHDELNESNEQIDSELENNKKKEEKELDLSKCLNNNNIKYSDPSDIEGNYGLSMTINPDKTSITLSINWSIFGPLSTATAWAPSTESYQITGFSKNVNSTFVGELGQDSMGITLFYLMEDGTVEYMPMFNLKYDSYNNSFYVMNYTYDYSSDGRATNAHFTTKGSVAGVSNVIKLYNINASYGFGWRTVIGATKDGSFYDLGSIINKN